MRALRVLLLIAAACAVYANSFGVPFIFDDRSAIVSNLRIRDLWPGPFTSARPILELTLAINYALGGLGVFGVQLVAAYGREDILIRIASQLEQAKPWAHRTPEV